MRLIKRLLNNQVVRDEFVGRALLELDAGSSILDAGAGSQRYRELCSHLRYVAQDFCKVTLDERMGLTGLAEKYRYGRIDLVCDIAAIPVGNNQFDAVLCTEVLEHVPDPVSAIAELARVLKSGGTLILTVPSNCLRHFDPYFYFSGFSDRFVKHWCSVYGLELVTMETVGNYWSWLMVELARSIKNAPWSALALFPAFAYYFVRSRFSDPVAEATLCMGYHVIARKR